MELTRIICYANLNDFNCPQGITDEHMRAFFEQYHKDEEIEIVDVIIDRGPNTDSLSKRDGWKEVLRQCEEKDIHLISVPSSTMVACNLTGLLYTLRETKQQYNAGFTLRMNIYVPATPMQKQHCNSCISSCQSRNTSRRRQIKCV